MDIDSEHLGIPKTEYNCTIQVREMTMAASGGGGTAHQVRTFSRNSRSVPRMPVDNV